MVDDLKQFFIFIEQNDYYIMTSEKFMRKMGNKKKTFVGKGFDLN